MPAHQRLRLEDDRGFEHGREQLILLFFIFYALPLALDMDIPPYPAAITALSLHCSAYMAEIVRSGIQSIRKGQWEAARRNNLDRHWRFSGKAALSPCKSATPHAA